MNLPHHPFEATPEQLLDNIESYVDRSIESLQSFFLVMPRGSEFVDFPQFQQAYEVLLRETHNLDQISADTALAAVQQDSLVLVVLRTIVGLTPPELAHIATTTLSADIDQSAARRLDKQAKQRRSLFVRTRQKTQEQAIALIRTAVQLIQQGAPPVSEGLIHRLDQVDTREGLEGIRKLARSGVPYVSFLYERFLGRPFATHRDSISEKVGDALENVVRGLLQRNRIPYYEAGVAERFEDMDQAPDFFIPDQFHTSVVIEAKLAEDDGTARDKVTRIQHLAELRDRRLQNGLPAYEVVACVDGRGFGIRRERVRALLLATRGKLFTSRTVGRILDTTSIRTLVRYP